MPSTLPTPVAAALGVVPTVLDGVRRLPAKAIQLPVLAIGTGLSTIEHARRTYETLAERGEKVVGHLRGEAEDLAEDISGRADQLEDRLEDLLAGTPVAKAYDRAEDALEDAADAVKDKVAGKTPTEVVAEVAGDAKDTVNAVAGKANSLADDLKDELAGAADAVEDAVPEAEQPKGEPTPKAPSGETERVDTAASAETVAVVEQAAAATDVVEVKDHDDLPLADYDHMTLGSLRGRLRSLSVDELLTVRAYEKAHADRLPVVTMLDNRIERLSTEQATPSEPGPAAAAPVKKAAARKPRVTPATAAEPSGAPTGSGPTRPLN